MASCNVSSDDSIEASSDSQDRSDTYGLITQNMIKEEERLQEDTEKNNKVSASEHEFSGMVVSQRYARLQHLLNKSGIYSKILLNRMNHQREENKKKMMMKRKPGRKKAKKEDVNIETSSTPVAKIKTRSSSGRGRKRKAADCDESYQLSDFMDENGKLRKRPKHEKKETKSNGSTKLDKELTKQEETEIEEERFFEGKPIPIGQPKLLTGGIMRPYQLDGTEWLKVLYENGVNGILADEMGLGKTIQCIALIAHLVEMGVLGPYLVVAPLSTVPNWVSEFKRFTPEIPVVLYHGSISERDKLRRKIFSSRRTSLNSLMPVFVTSYEVVMKDHKYLAHKEWKLLIVDEGHRIKNLNCTLIKMLKSYNAGNRLLLTGTPLQNNLTELWSLLNFILPDIFDDLSNFQSWFDFSSVVENAEESTSEIIAKEKEDHVLSTLHEILSPFLLRRLKCDVELNIPPKKEILVYAPLTPLQEKYYSGILNKTIEQLLNSQNKDTLHEWGMTGDTDNKENNGSGRSVRKRIQLTKLIDDEKFDDMLINGVADEDMQLFGMSTNDTSKRKLLPDCSVSRVKMTCVWVMLRKCCNHPYLVDFPKLQNGELKVDEEIISSCGKMLVLDQMMRALIPAGHKVLIFSQMTLLLDLLEDFMDLRGLGYARLDGSTKFEDRVTEMQRFKDSPDCNVFLLSTRAGGLGINLTTADTVIIYDSDWNPQCDLQAQDRCHRIGQTKPVIVYRFVTSNTIDQRIVERAAGKRRLEKMVIHKDRFKGYNKATASNLSMDDLVDLLKSVDHDKVFDSQQVFSSEVMEALLDRNFGDTKDKKISEHSEFFTVLEEQKTSENTFGGVNNDNVPNTVDNMNTDNTIDGATGDAMGGVSTNTDNGEVSTDNNMDTVNTNTDDTVGGVSMDIVMNGVGVDNAMDGVNVDTDNDMGGVSTDAANNGTNEVNADTDDTVDGVSTESKAVMNEVNTNSTGDEVTDDAMDRVTTDNEVIATDNTVGGVSISINTVMDEVGDNNVTDGVNVSPNEVENDLDGVSNTLGGVSTNIDDIVGGVSTDSNDVLCQINTDNTLSAEVNTNDTMCMVDVADASTDTTGSVYINTLVNTDGMDRVNTDRQVELANGSNGMDDFDTRDVMMRGGVSPDTCRDVSFIDNNTSPAGDMLDDIDKEMGVASNSNGLLELGL